MKPEENNFKEQVKGHCFKQNLPGGGDWSINHQLPN